MLLVEAYTNNLKLGVMEMRKLNETEINEVNGGVVPFLVLAGKALGGAAVVAGACAMVVTFYDYMLK